MKMTETYIPSSAAGQRLHVTIWRPEGEVRAVLQMVHGMSEYIGRYGDLAGFFCAHGIAAIGHDHLGHGRTARKPEDLGFFGEESAKAALIEDMYAVTRTARREFPGAPVFLLGHSMGSFFTRRYLAVHGGEIAGAVIMGTGWVPAPVPSVGVLLAKLACAVRGPRYRSPLLENLALGRSERAFAAEGKLAWLSTNADNARLYEADPLCGFSFTAGAYRDFFGILADVAAEKGYDAVPRTLPVLVTSGAEDPIGGGAAVTKVAGEYRRLGLRDVTEKVFPGDRHEICNEKDREAVFDSLLA